MTDPGTIGAAITGIVSLLSAYMTYKVGMKQAEQKDTAAPARPDETTLTQGETAITVVKQGVTQYGDADEQTDLANFERNPERYKDGLERVLRDVAGREDAFAQQIQTLATEANIQTGGVHGSVNVSGDGKIYGPSAGVSTGTMSGTYNFSDDEDAQKK